MTSNEQSLLFRMDGYEVFATFSNTPNNNVDSQVKQILLSCFVANTSKGTTKGILAFNPKQRDNSKGEAHVL